MPRRRYIFDPPERFVAGTIGEPGDRTFFLQAREGARVVSIVLEKIQVSVLAERLGEPLRLYCFHGLAPNKSRFENRGRTSAPGRPASCREMKKDSSSS